MLQEAPVIGHVEGQLMHINHLAESRIFASLALQCMNDW
jgi:hypothetical protein